MKRITIIRDKTMLGLVLVSLALQIRGIVDGMINGALAFMPYTIQLQFNIKSKSMPIRVLDLEHNEDKYRQVMEELKAHCGAEVDVNRAMGHLKTADKRRYKSGDAVPKIKGWLKLLMVQIMGVVALGVLMFMLSFLLVLLPIDGEQAATLVPMLVGIGAIWPIAIIAMVLALRKRRVAILWLTIYQWATMVMWIGSLLYQAIFVKTPAGFVGYGRLVLGIIGIVVSTLIVVRYLKLSRRVERTFIYERYVKGGKKGSRPQQPMAKWKVLILVLVAGLVLYIGFLGIRYYNSIDKAVYGSVGEIIDTNYGGEDVQTLEAGDFCYVIMEEGHYEGPYWRRDDGQYVCVNEWHEETMDAREVYDSISEDEILAFVYVYNHDGQYSLYIDICRFDEDKGVQVVDTFGEIMPLHMYDEDHYLKVMDMDSVPEDYRLEIKVGDEVVYTATKEDIDYEAQRAKRKAELMEKYGTEDE